MTQAPHGGRPRRLLRRVLIVGALAVVLLFAAVAAVVAFGDLDGLARRAVDRALPEASARLGRSVEVQDVHVQLFPRPAVAVRGVRVEGRGGVPLADVGEARANLRVWPLLRSLGKDVRVDSVVVERPVLNVVRDGAGRWVDEDVVERAGQKPSGGGEERELRIGEVLVTDGRVSLRTMLRGAAPREELALTDLRIEADDVAPNRPLVAALSGRLADAPLKGHVRLDPTATVPSSSGDVQLEGLALEKLAPAAGVDGLGGRVALDLTWKTSNAQYVVSGHLNGKELRAGGAPLDLVAPITGSVTPGKPESAALRIDDGRVTGPGVDLKISLDAKPLAKRARLTVQGDQLDVAALSAFTSKGQEPAKRPSKAAPESSSALRAWSGEATARFGTVRSGKLVATDATADATLANGVVTLRNAGAMVEGARLVLDGTRVALGPPLRWDLSAQLQGLDLAHAVDRQLTQIDATGAMNAQVSLQGTGSTPDEVRRGVTGTVSLAFDDATLQGPDVGSVLEQGLLGELRKSTVGSLLAGAAPQESLGKTELKDLRIDGSVRDGWVTLARPIALDTRIGKLSVGGRVGLDRRLDLTGTIALTPSFVQSLTRGRFTPSEPIAVPLELGGTVSKPVVEGLKADALVSSIARGALGESPEKGLQDVLRGRFPGL